MIRVAVRLYASLRSYGPDLPVGAPVMVEMEEGASVADLVARLRIPLAEMRLAFVNGRNQESDAILRTGDEVGLFPPIAGGEQLVMIQMGSAPGVGVGSGHRDRGLL